MFKCLQDVDLNTDHAFDIMKKGCFLTPVWKMVTSYLSLDEHKRYVIIFFENNRLFNVLNIKVASTESEAINCDKFIAFMYVQEKILNN